MQMRPGSAASASTQPNNLPALDHIAFLHLELGKMQIEGQQSLPVIEYHTVPLKIKGTRQQNRPGIESRDWSASRDGEIESLVCTLHLAIEFPLRAKHVGDAGIDRRVKVA
jgi:hypothetical protein